MDPITMAIITALGNLGVTVIDDAYQALKAALQHKYGLDSDLVGAVEKLEKKPDSAARQDTLQEEVAAAGADKDAEIMKMVEKLIDLMNSTSSADSGSVNVNISGGQNKGIFGVKEIKGGTFNIGDLVD
jgi:hypothetical protein